MKDVLKWKEACGSDEWYVNFPREQDADLYDRISTESEKLYNKLNLVAYCRFDIRVDINNIPFFLEANPMCGFGGPSTSDTIIQGTVGYKYVINYLIQNANQRPKLC